MAAMRVRLGEDVVVEVDSPDDAVRLALTYAASKQNPSFMAGVQISPSRPPVRFPQPPKKNLARVVFKNGHYRGFEALYAANTAGVVSEALAELLGLSGVKSLPPTVGAWGKRAASVHLNLKELLEVDRGFAHGKSTTIYRLTAKGREVFRPEIEEAQAAGA
jgi:hypothetical protein